MKKKKTNKAAEPVQDVTAAQVLVLEEAVAVPGIQQQLPQTFKDNEKTIQGAIECGTTVVALLNVDPTAATPIEQLSAVGVTGHILGRESAITDDGMELLLFDGEQRVKTVMVLGTASEGTLHALLEPYPIVYDIDTVAGKAYLHEIHQIYDRVMQLADPELPAANVPDYSKPGNLHHAFYFMLFTSPVSPEGKNEVMSREKISEMLREFLDQLAQTEKFFTMRADIHSKVERVMADNQRENFIREELAMLHEELGDRDINDVDELKKRAEAKSWNEETQKHFDRELRKLQRYPTNTPDYSIQYNYLDTFLNLPWNHNAKIEIDFTHIAEVLDRDHFGLEKVKERILEQMAVAKLREDNRAPILCLVGPPGVGKTSLGKSIAEAMGREYARVSFGGMRDEAEIRGHRRTYLGAMPGRLISALTKGEYSNPVMVLDEIDKIGKDFKGDPSTALLEVLDPEQNAKFHDNYLDADYDLSNILFIATANSLETISAPLLDRMEIISIPGYITPEKVEIALRHLVPKQLKENGFGEKEVSFEEPALVYMIEYYTREAGVRRLEKIIAKVLRRLAVKKVQGLAYPRTITKEMIPELLGKIEFNPDSYDNNDFTGVVTGLAWTSVGGEILFIESSVTPGKGKLTLTGNLGDVMKESATIALQYLRANSSLLRLEAEEFDKRDYHIHVPEGAIPKDGPSAGITMATSLASALTGRKVRGKLAMTGEITLRGKVLPVGGIKEKIIAAKRAGITEIILSKENEKDIAEIAERYIEGLTFTYVTTVREVLERALL